MRVATMATGGIGGFLAVKLANSGHQVATIARGSHLAAIRKDGLTLEDASGVEVAHPWMVPNSTTCSDTNLAMLQGLAHATEPMTYDICLVDDLLDADAYHAMMVGSSGGATPGLPRPGRRVVAAAWRIP